MAPAVMREEIRRRYIRRCDIPCEKFITRLFTAELKRIRNCKSTQTTSSVTTARSKIAIRHVSCLEDFIREDLERRIIPRHAHRAVTAKLLQLDALEEQLLKRWVLMRRVFYKAFRFLNNCYPCATGLRRCQEMHSYTSRL